MKKELITKEEYKNAIEALGIGANVKLEINRTRKVTEIVTGIIISISNYFFTVQDVDRSYYKKSCSYADMVCGTVKVENLKLASAEKVS